MNIHPSRLFLAPLASLALASPVFAAVSIPLNPVADAFLSSANPTGNFGGGGAVAISAPGLPKGELQSLMMFNFAGAKTQLDTTYGVGGWSVDSISLQLAAANPGSTVFNTSASGDIGVRWFDDDTWTEGLGTPASSAVPGVNFNSLPALLGSGTETVGSFAFGGGTSGANLFALNPSTGLLADILGGRTASLNLHATDTTASGVFNSRSFSVPANWPVLTLNASAIPEPSAGILAIAALTIPTFRRRR